MSPYHTISAAHMTRALVQCGVAAGDVVFLHVDDPVAGQLPSLPAAERFNLLIEAVLGVIGPKGTLVMPTYTYSFARAEVFDRTLSSSVLGAVSEHFRRRPGVRRSSNPMYSVAACGRHAEAFADADAEDCFGPDTSFGVLHRLGGKVVCAGRGFSRLAFSQYIEQSTGVDYRSFRRFQGVTTARDGTLWPARVRCYTRDPKRSAEGDCSRLYAAVRDMGLLRTAHLCGSKVRAIDADDLYRAGIAMLLRDAAQPQSGFQAKGTVAA
jgi:Aminoglycoside N3''-acetyltransferase